MASIISRLFKAAAPKTATMPATPVSIPEGAERATLAAGCFWGVEHLFRKHFADKGLYDARVGYIGGDTADPSYKAVCSGNTGRTLTSSSTALKPKADSRPQTPKRPS